MKPRRKETEAWLEAIVTAAVDAIVLIDGQGDVCFVNPAFERIFGYTASEVLGKNVATLMPPQYANEHDEYLRRYRESGEARIIGIGREVVGQRSDGSTFPIDLAVSEVQVRGQPLFAGVIRDISERKRAEALMRRRVLQQQTVARLGLDAIGGTDPKELMVTAGRVVRTQIEAEYSEVLAVSPDDGRLVVHSAEGWTAQDQYPSADLGLDATSIAAHAFRERKTVLFDDASESLPFRLTEPQRQCGVVSGVAVCILGVDQPIGVLAAYSRQPGRFTPEDATFLVSVANVISEAVLQKESNRRLLEHENLAQLGKLAAMVAHEVKNPIAGIGGALEIIRQRVAGDDETVSVIGEIMDRLGDLNRVVNDLLFFARPLRATTSAVPIRELLMHTVRALESDPEFPQLRVSVESPDLLVACDAEILRPVILNVLVNAAQAMKGRGEIRVVASRSTGRRGKACEVRFFDNGPGIAEEVRSTLFEPFVTTKARGTGLGLSVARRAVEFFGGSMSVEQTSSSGTTILMSLPLAVESET